MESSFSSTLCLASSRLIVLLSCLGRYVRSVMCWCVLVWQFESRRFVVVGTDSDSCCVTVLIWVYVTGVMLCYGFDFVLWFLVVLQVLLCNFSVPLTCVLQAYFIVLGLRSRVCWGEAQNLCFWIGMKAKRVWLFLDWCGWGWELFVGLASDLDLD